MVSVIGIVTVLFIAGVCSSSFAMDPPLHSIRGNAARLRHYPRLSVLDRTLARLQNDTRYDVFPYTEQPGFGLQPIPYRSPYRSVRLVLLPIPPSVGDLMLAAGRRILKALPADFRKRRYDNPVETFHVTVYHFGRPEAPRPLHSQQEVNREKEHAKTVATGYLPLRLRPVGFTLTPFGALILTYTDAPDGVVDRLRDAYRSNFPNATSTTFGVLHTTLWRSFAAHRPFTQREVRIIASACHKALKSLPTDVLAQGFEVRHLWYVLERWHATIEGEREVWGVDGGSLRVERPLHPFALPPRTS